MKDKILNDYIMNGDYDFLSEYAESLHKIILGIQRFGLIYGKTVTNVLPLLKAADSYKDNASFCGFISKKVSNVLASFSCCNYEISKEGPNGEDSVMYIPVVFRISPSILNPSEGTTVLSLRFIVESYNKFIEDIRKILINFPIIDELDYKILSKDILSIYSEMISFEDSINTLFLDSSYIKNRITVNAYNARMNITIKSFTDIYDYAVESIKYFDDIYLNILEMYNGTLKLINISDPSDMNDENMIYQTIKELYDVFTGKSIFDNDDEDDEEITDKDDYGFFDNP